MTNGEKIKEIFPNAEYLECEVVMDVVFARNQENWFDLDWWNAEYKEPTTKNNVGVDCIDRTELLKAINTWDKFGCDADTKLVPYQDHYIPYIHYDDVIKCIKSMPSVTPQPTKNDLGVDCISRDAVLKPYEGLKDEDTISVWLIRKNIEQQPFVKQEPKIGHWIDTDEWRETVDGFEQWGYFRKCSKCGYVFKFLEIDNYCPNCGAKMVESQEK